MYTLKPVILNTTNVCHFFNVNYTSIKLFKNNQLTEPVMCYGQLYVQDQEEELNLSRQNSCCLRQTSERASLPWWFRGKESACPCRRCERCGFHPWVGKNPWRRKLHPTPVFLSEKSQGQRSLCRLHNPWGHKRG